MGEKKSPIPYCSTQHSIRAERLALESSKRRAHEKCGFTTNLLVSSPGIELLMDGVSACPINTNAVIVYIPST